MPAPVPVPLRRILALGALAAVSACTPPPPAVVAPAVDPEQLALALEDRTSLDQPTRILFEWQMNEAGVRARGRGVARIEPPYRARLDLFMGSGETAARAALVDGDLRLAPGARRELLPPPDLLWGVLGVFRPEFGIELMGADRLEGGQHQLRYRYADGTELHFRVDEGRVRTMELRRGGHAVERVELELAEGERFPVEATYRNLADFRELRITRASVDVVEPYPPDIWDPSGIRGGS
ncbi:MAG: hypothetical protein RJQ04_00990 [Longimicrobiales bacterium]